jgi:hypothetical protein
MEPVRLPDRRPKDIPTDHGMAEGANSLEMLYLETNSR